MQKTLIFSFFMVVTSMAMYSCKNGTATHDTHTEDIHELHVIETIKGLITINNDTGNPVEDVILSLKFNDAPVFAFSNPEIMAAIAGTDSVYMYMAKNASIAQNSFGNHNEITGDFIEIANPVHIPNEEAGTLIGRWGCVPKFSFVGDALAITSQGKLPMFIAKHETGSHDPIKPILAYFPIASDCYEVLNKLVIDNKELEGGLDTILDLGIMDIYENRRTQILNITATTCSEP
jgi:hypothetical protein